ncbi:hypothetical protein FBEOM_12908 [Fusarium beomiforme]|uniref:Uncharacterized protein n=1 Tax=Fusarium beomiforme TaxID=44412 RepID=A0A9P5A6T0_9HYPO|nr:hypothetical protein FBEOM_12908 [Fusarium beomiforme]
MDDHIAFSPRGQAYDTGKTERQLYQLLRIRRDVSSQSKNAAQTLTFELEPQDQQHISREEKQIKNVYSQDIVMVIGELLPVDFQIKETSVKARPDDFISNSSNTVPTQPKSGLIVKRINDKLCNLQLLHSRLNGLRLISALPNNDDTLKRIFYYREFTRVVDNSRHKERRIIFNANVNKATEEYLSTHKDDFLDLVLASDIVKDKNASASLCPIDAIVTKVQFAIRLYEETGNESHKKQAEMFVGDAMRSVD